MYQHLTLDQHLSGPGPKRVLSLDGGGVRGLVTLGILKKVETLLAARYRDDGFRLCDYFDLIGGTSTGALIAALLALGAKVDDIIKLYREMIPKIFYRRYAFQGISAKFDSNALERAINYTLTDVLKRAGRNSDLNALKMDTDLLKTGLAVVMKRIDTGSVWALTNSKQAKFWDPKSALWHDHLAKYNDLEFFPNSDYRLARIVQASASAPFYLDGIDVDVSDHERGHFLDGGASPFNNPSQELFLMLALRARGPGWNNEQIGPYGFKWDVGADKLFMLSLGCGTCRMRIAREAFVRKWAFGKAIHALTAIMDDASTHAVVWMQAISKRPGDEVVNSKQPGDDTQGHEVNRNLLDMQNLRVLEQPLLTFRRINPHLEQKWLEQALNLKYTPVVIDRLREIDRSDAGNLERLLKIGMAMGERSVSDKDFPANFDLPEARVAQVA